MVVSHYLHPYGGGEWTLLTPRDPACTLRRTGHYGGKNVHRPPLQSEAYTTFRAPG